VAFNLKSISSGPGTLRFHRSLAKARGVLQEGFPQLHQNLIDLNGVGDSESLGNQSFDTILEATVRHPAPDK